MGNWLTFATLALAALAALFAILAFLRSGRAQNADALTAAQFAELQRKEFDEIRRASEEQARAARQELSENLRGFQDATLKAFRDLGDLLGQQVKTFGERLDAGVKAIDERAAVIATKLDLDITQMGEDATRNREALRENIEKKLTDASRGQGEAARQFREELIGNFQRLAGSLSESFNQLGVQQKERLDNVVGALTQLTEKHERAQETLKQTVESRLDAMRTENTAKLDEMRKTVDEKLQSTLETRLGESFNRVVEQLERVHKGIGEMQSLAAGVGDLKKVLSNVRIRGTFGEVQLGALLEQFLAPDQYVRNAQVKENTQERVEFAVRLPGRDGEGEVLLPIDAKFPQEDYERLLAAAEIGDTEAILQASKDLEVRVRQCAKTISEKYIAVPKTTEFAILFLPTESLYAEILRRPGFFEQLQREYRVTLAGPTTFSALLNALQMGFRSLAIEKRSSEVWRILGAVRGEFGKYNRVVDQLARQLNTAAKSVESLGVRTRVMDRKLRDVEKLPDEAATLLLGATIEALEGNEDIEEAIPEE